MKGHRQSDHAQLVNLRTMLHQLLISAEVLAWADEIMYDQDVDDSFEAEYMRWSERWKQASSGLHGHLERCWMKEHRVS